MQIEADYKGVSFQVFGPDPGEAGEYFLKIVDKVNGIVLMSMINAETQGRYQEAIGIERNWEREYGLMFAIRESNGRAYETVCPVDKKKYFARFNVEANRFAATPFSSFVIFDGEGEVIGRLGMGQGYDKSEAEPEVVLAGITDEALRDKHVYAPSANETQLAVLLAPEAYERNYQATKELGTKVAAFLVQLGLGKPLNAGEEGYFERPRPLVDRWTFTIVDARLVKPGQVTEAARRLLDFKQAQIEELEGRGVVRNYGYLMPKSIDPRNYSELPRIVYGQP